MGICSFPSRTAAVVLIGTYPWNSSEIDALVPRALLPVGHRPLVSYAFDWLYAAGIRRAVLCGNRHTWAFHAAAMQCAPAGLLVSDLLDPVPRGSAGSTRDAASNISADTLVVVDGTTIQAAPLEQVLAMHIACSAAATVVVHAEPSRDASVIQVSSGAYVFERSATDLIPAGGFCDIKEDLIARLYRDGQRVIAYRAHAPDARVLDLESYLAVNGWMVQRMVGAPAPADHAVVGHALIHAKASVSTNALLIGPVSIGRGAVVGDRALIVGPTSIGADSIIGEDAVISRSAVWSGAILDRAAIAERSVIADGVRLDSRSRVFGQVVAAERHRDRPIRAEIETARRSDYPTELRRRMRRLLTPSELTRPATFR
jgi:NDP-sugar pyrophosphorylase family protein